MTTPKNTNDPFNILAGVPVHGPLWTLETAIPVVRAMEKIAAQNGFHVGLTGSCLYKGQSSKDLDVVVYPHDTRAHNTRDQLLQAFEAAGYPGQYKVSTNYNDKDVVVTASEGRRIDLFFLS